MGILEDPPRSPGSMPYRKDKAGGLFPQTQDTHDFLLH